MVFLRVFIIVIFGMSLWAETPQETAENWLKSQVTTAVSSVAIAKKRVEIAQSDLQSSKNLAQELNTNHDTSAKAIVEEAIKVNEKGVLEAEHLLERANIFLTNQRKRLKETIALQDHITKDTSVMIPLEGQVQHFFNNKTKNTDTSAILQVGETISTGDNASARLFTAKGDAQISLSSNTEMTIERQDNESFVADLHKGYIRIEAILKEYVYKPFQVRTPAAVCGVRGTEFSVKYDGSITYIEVFKGTVHVSTLDQTDSADIHAGETAEIRDNKIMLFSLGVKRL